MNEAKLEKRIQKGACSVSIFAQQMEKDGREFMQRRAVFQKRYKDAQGDWQSTQSLNTNDIPKAILALEAAYDHLVSDQGKLPERP